MAYLRKTALQRLPPINRAQAAATGQVLCCDQDGAGIRANIRIPYHATNISCKNPDMRFLLSALLATCAMSFGLQSSIAEAASPCRAIQFKPGASSATLQGTVPADPSGSAENIECFRFGTRKGQRVRISVRSPRQQVAFTIKELVDNREQYEFTSEKRTYEFSVYQTMRSATSAPYTLTLSIQ